MVVYTCIPSTQGKWGKNEIIQLSYIVKDPVSKQIEKTVVVILCSVCIIGISPERG